MSSKFMVLDTEACNIVHRAGSPRAKEMRVYDLGFVVADKDGIVYERESLMDFSRLQQRDIYTNRDGRLVESAYYANKLPQYYAGMGTLWKPCDFWEIWNIVSEAIDHHHITKVYAYNAKFDHETLDATICETSNGFKQSFLPGGVEWRDIWAIAGECLTNTKRYVKWCYEHKFITGKGNPSTSAETVYRYITDDPSFIEDHTALSDAEIELAILLKCFKRKKKQPKKLGDGWRNAAKVCKEMKKAK